jgi:hypothetical protein
MSKISKNQKMNAEQFNNTLFLVFVLVGALVIKLIHNSLSLRKELIELDEKAERIHALVQNTIGPSINEHVKEFDILHNLLKKNESRCKELLLSIDALETRITNLDKITLKKELPKNEKKSWTIFYN